MIFHLLRENRTWNMLEYVSNSKNEIKHSYQQENVPEKKMFENKKKVMTRFHFPKFSRFCYFFLVNGTPGLYFYRRANFHFHVDKHSFKRCVKMTNDFYCSRSRLLKFNHFLHSRREPAKRAFYYKGAFLLNLKFVALKAFLNFTF